MNFYYVNQDYFSLILTCCTYTQCNYYYACIRHLHHINVCCLIYYIVFLWHKSYNIIININYKLQ